MTTLVRLCGAAMALLLWLGAPGEPRARAAAQGGIATLQAQRNQIALNLSQPIASCAARRDTGNAAFHGCVDWHSAVHGTWALVAYTALTHDQRYAPLLRSLLTPNNIASEERFIRANPQFEMPYGRSWFLRLAIEQGKLSHDKLLIQMGDTVAQSLYDRYQRQHAQPLSGAYDSDSWALINLMDYYRYRGDATKLAVVKGVVLRDFANAGLHRCNQNLERPQFMAICTNVAWAVSEVLDRATFAKWLAAFLPVSALQPAITQPKSDHENGLDFSRAWGLWAIYAATGDPAYRQAYLDNFETAYADKAMWDGPYDTVSHWVAQFGMFALRPAFGPAP